VGEGWGWAVGGWRIDTWVKAHLTETGDDVWYVWQCGGGPALFPIQETLEKNQISQKCKVKKKHPPA